MDGFIRPDPVTLSESSMVPEKNLITPPPDQFTHEMTRRQPFYFTGSDQADSPNGEFPAGTKVVLMMYKGGTYCRVVDGQGLYVEVEFEGLRRL